MVATGIVEIYIHESRSLKEKRSVLRKITHRIQNTFNVSVAEVGAGDHWKRSIIGFSMVGNEKGFINSKVDKLIGFIEGMNLADIVNTHVEIVSMSDDTAGSAGSRETYDDF